jgi:multidrug efflux system membrane fusion protein
VINGDQTVAMRPVQVLRNYAGGGAPEQAVIGSGLKEGETVISEGQMLLMPGTKVRVLKANSSSEKASVAAEAVMGS